MSKNNYLFVCKTSNLMIDLQVQTSRHSKMAQSVHTLVDLDFLIRFEKVGQPERVIASKTLQSELDQIDPKFFKKFTDRAYREMKEEYTCKLRSGIIVTFVAR